MNKQNINRLIKKMFFLPPIPTLLISIPSYILVIYALEDKSMNPAITYLAYLISAYAFTITITGISGIVYWIRKGIEQHPLARKLLRIPLLNRYFSEDVFRAEAALYQGFLINLAYTGIKLFSGIYYKSIWFITLAVYYFLLSVMRFSLLHHKNSKWRRYRLCGIILLFMNQALVGIIILAVHENSSFEYPGMLIYIMALYAFYAAITAVVNVVKFRKYGNPILSAAKVIDLTAALVSILSLETAMLTQLGSAGDTGFRLIMTAATGVGVSAIVLGMAVYMIAHATKCIKVLKTNKYKSAFIKILL